MEDLIDPVPVVPSSRPESTVAVETALPPPCHPLEEDGESVSTTTRQQICKLNDSKAGMKGLDLDRINKIIEETSEGSKFYEHKKKAKRKLEARALEMRQQYDRLPATAIKDSERKIDKIAKELEASRDDSRIMVHIDMDCFFAAVETRDNPALKNQPMAVGSMSMLSTSNYEARKFGVRAAMPGFIAKKLCPSLVIIPTNFRKYSAASALAHEVYKQYDPECHSCIDEARLDITDYVKSNLLEGDDEDEKIEAIVREIRQKVEIATGGLTCSAGISPTGFLSKICSDINKPNGQFRVRASEVKNFLTSLKIRKVCGIGEATETLLRSIDILTCGNIWEKRGAVNLLFKPATADFLLRVSLGLGNHFFSFPPPSGTDNSSSSDDRKSISCERTFSETGSIEFLTELCQHLATELAEDLNSKECKGRAVAVKIKTDTYDVKTRIRTLPDYISEPDVIFKTAMSILDSLRREQEGMILRLLGLRISSLKFNNPGEASSSSSSAKQFWQNFMEPEAVHECPLCAKSFTTTFSLRKHVDKCLDEQEGSAPQEEKPNHSIAPPPPEGTPSTNIAGLKREHSNEAGDSSLESGSVKRIKTCAILSDCNSSTSTSTAAAKSTQVSKSSNKPSSSSNVIKMMPINFYFQSKPKKDAS